MCLLLDTGLRIEEALTLRRSDVDFENLLLICSCASHLKAMKRLVPARSSRSDFVETEVDSPRQSLRENPETRPSFPSAMSSSARPGLASGLIPIRCSAIGFATSPVIRTC